MMLIRCSALVVLTAIALPLAAQPAASDHDPHSPTPRENEIFYPLVCIGPRPPDPRLPEDGRSCSKLLGAPNLELLPSNANVAGGDSIDITFNVIAYGSFTKAGADEAYITYNSSMEPEGDLGGGGILFRREHSRWNLVKVIHGGQMTDCIALPGAGQQRMLCTITQHHCCGATNAFLKVITGIDIDRYDDKDSILKAGDSARAYEHGTGDAGGYEFCKAGEEDRTLLVSLNKPERSDQPGIFAIVDVAYVLPKEINRACGIHEPGDAKAVSGQVRFRLDGDKVNVLLPEGVKAFSVY